MSPTETVMGGSPAYHAVTHPLGDNSRQVNLFIVAY